MSADTPTLYEWAGGGKALERLTELFYEKVRADELLEPVFRGMDAHHPQYVAMWLGEVFGDQRATRRSAAAIRACSRSTAGVPSPSRCGGAGSS